MIRILFITIMYGLVSSCIVHKAKSQVPTNIIFQDSIVGWDCRTNNKLDIIYNLIKSHEGTIYFICHTEDRGTKNGNLVLSENIAKRIVNCMAEKYGINRERMIAEGKGESTPLFFERDTFFSTKYSRLEIPRYTKIDSMFIHNLPTLGQQEIARSLLRRVEIILK